MSNNVTVQMDRNRNPEVYTLAVGAQKELRIHAAARYSEQRIAVRAGESYSISCDGKQRWVDMVIWTSANGYPNFLARLFGMRVQGVRCFCLCGAYNESEAGAFAIGTNHTLRAVPEDGTLSFFANDVWGYEWNNWGAVDIQVTRIR